MRACIRVLHRLQHCHLVAERCTLLLLAGAAVAIDAAHVALFTDDLTCLAPVIKLGRQAKRKIGVNIGLSVVTKVRCKGCGL